MPVEGAKRRGKIVCRGSRHHRGSGSRLRTRSMRCTRSSIWVRKTPMTDDRTMIIDKSLTQFRQTHGEIVKPASVLVRNAGKLIEFSVVVVRDRDHLIQLAGVAVDRMIHIAEPT